MDLNNVDLLSLQTSYLKQDPFVKAMCKALNPYFQQLSDSVRLVYIYGRVDELEEEIVDSLAWQFHVDFYDYKLPLEKKKEMVKSSLKLHKIKGTPQAVIDSATTIFGRTKLKEWFEYDGKPYYFGLDIDITDEGATQENLMRLETLINSYKNKRSWIDYINMYLTNIGKLIYAAAIVSGEEITVYPYMPKDLESFGKVKIALKQTKDIEEVTTYPRKGIS